MAVELRPAPAQPPAPAPAPPSAPAPVAAPALDEAFAYADRVRPLAAADLAQEIQRLGDSAYSPLRAVQLAVVLAQSRGTAQLARAQALLQRVLADPAAEAQGLQPLARLLAHQLADQRRAEEQAERQAQQLRDAQRRIELLNDRLEAVRAIERSLPGAARPGAGEPGRPAPVPARP